MTAQVKLMKTVTIGGKELFVSEPYKPRRSEFVGRESETALIMAAWTAAFGRAPLNPLLTGEPGVGKNRLVYECAHVRQKPLFIVAVGRTRALFELAVKSQHKFVSSMFYTVNLISLTEVWGAGARALVRAWGEHPLILQRFFISKNPGHQDTRVH